MKRISGKILRTRLAFICALATLICSFVVLSQNAEAAELPEFFENMTIHYDCSANVKTLDGSVVFNITGQYIYTVKEMNENASIEQVFAVASMSGALPAEVSDFYFPIPTKSQSTIIEVPLVQPPTQYHYWSMFLDEALFTEYKTHGRFLGEENYDTKFGTVGTYHMQKVGAYDTYDVFYDKATGWVVYLRETYGGGEIPNYTVTYTIEIAETNASLCPPLPSAFPYHFLLILGILLATVVAVSIFFFRRKGKIKHNSSTNL